MAVKMVLLASICRLSCTDTSWLQDNNDAHALHPSSCPATSHCQLHFSLPRMCRYDAKALTPIRHAYADAGNTKSCIGSSLVACCTAIVCASMYVFASTFHRLSNALQSSGNAVERWGRAERCHLDAVQWSGQRAATLLSTEQGARSI